VYTDHKPNVFFDTTNMQSRRSARWLEALQGYCLKWNYKPGARNVVADAFNRHPAVQSEPGMVTYVGVLTATTPDAALMRDASFTQQLMAAYKTDVSFKPADYTEKDGLFYHEKAVVLPNDKSLQQLVLHECHDAPYAGHVGYLEDAEKRAALLLVAWHVKDCQAVRCHL
jgi:hypothetical protein